MEKSEPVRVMILRSSLIFLLLLLSGCALIFPEPPPPVVTAEPEPEPAPTIEVPPVAEPAPVVAPVREPEPVSPHVAVVLSDALPSYTSVVDELLPYLEDYSVYDLADGSRSPRQAFAAIAESDAQVIVAIGLYAAKVARSFATVPVVFSQVFNVEDNDLVSDEIKGVAVLPPLDLQVEAWREMDPGIRNIGAILGEGHEDLIAEAEQAMKERGIKFHYAIAHSDRESLYLFNRLIRDIDGFVLFPDNRILSRAVLTEIMTEASRHRVQVAVFNEKLLEHGATYSASSVDSNIADKITITLNDVLDGNFEDVAPLTPLSEIRIQTNPAMVQKFGLDLSGVEMGNSVAEAQ